MRRLNSEQRAAIRESFEATLVACENIDRPITARYIAAGRQCMELGVPLYLDRRARRAAYIKAGLGELWKT